MDKTIRDIPRRFRAAPLCEFLSSDAGCRHSGPKHPSGLITVKDTVEVIHGGRANRISVGVFIANSANTRRKLMFFLVAIQEIKS